MSTGAVYSYDSLGRLSNVTFSSGSMVTYNYDDMGNRSTVVEASSCCGAQFTIYTKSGSFAATDGAGSYYRNSSTGTITLPASPADGGVYKFKVTSGTSTFAFSGSDTINHANGVSDQNLILTTISGTLELIAVSGGWDET